MVEKNEGKAVSNPDLRSVTVLIHGSVVVAYGISSGKAEDPHRGMKYFVDYYV
jgi:hypothetical protein